MAHQIEFIKSDEVNGKKHKKGDIISVGSSHYARLKSNGSIKDCTEKKSKSKE